MDLSGVGLAELLLGKRPAVLGQAADQLEFQLLMHVLGKVIIAGYVSGECESELGGESRAKPMPEALASPMTPIQRSYPRVIHARGVVESVI